MNESEIVLRYKEALSYCLEHSGFYRKTLNPFVSEIDGFTCIGDFNRLPLTSKQDLNQYNRDFWSVDEGNILDYCTTSGTEGKPLIVPLTHSDILRLGLNEKGSFELAGLTEEDTILLSTTIDKQFMAGLAYKEGANNLGAGLIRLGPGVSSMQWNAILDLKPTAIVVVPSFLLRLIEYAEENGIDYKASSLKKAICIGEPIRTIDFQLSGAAEQILAKWPLQLYSTYASSEIQTAFTECQFQRGGHYNPELIYPEILLEDGSQASPGEYGELVVTSFGVRGLPLIRFKTGDITFLETDPCPCGHHSYRLGPIIGRKNQMIKVRGTSCYPATIFNILNKSGIKDFQIKVRSDEFGLDQVTIYYSNEPRLKKEDLEKRLRAALRFRPELSEMNASDLQNMVYPSESRKAVRFKDERNNNISGT